MDKQTLGNLFNRIIGTSTDKSSCGSGLGKAIARQLAEAHRGMVEAESELERGTTIMFLFRGYLGLRYRNSSQLCMKV
ncbi:ATP-binding protein [Paenibacillus alvei]|nr:ATP-binding protein [Paenibacillus alvei]